MSLDQPHEQPGRRRRRVPLGSSADVAVEQPPVAAQAQTATVSERDRLLQQREEELRLLRQDHVRLAGRLWTIEGELVASREERRRAAIADWTEGASPPDVQPVPMSLNLEPTRKTAVCPYLASYSNRAEQSRTPSNRQVCYAIGHALWSYGPADLEVQKDVCLRKSIYPRCPRYQDARSREVGDQQGPNDQKPWWRFWR